MNGDPLQAVNAAFWNELCGSQLARTLGIADASPASLRKFDEWYFGFYPYLFDHIPFEALRGKDVLEVGLGYGSVSQRLAESGAVYQGLDVAEEAVAMVNHRLEQANLPGRAVLGSILEPPFAPGSFDAIVAIGCLHHTGDLRLAIHRCWEMLRCEGCLVFMVYYAYSYRRFRMAPWVTLAYLAKELLGYRDVVGSSAPCERAAYDSDSHGSAAPHTDWISSLSLKSLCVQFAVVQTRLENIDQESPFSRTPRARLLKTGWPHRLGLDLYATAVK